MSKLFGTSGSASWECEVVITVTVARKPGAPESRTMVSCVLSTGSGALNIDGSRILSETAVTTHSRSPEASKKENRPVYGEFGPVGTTQSRGQKLGRWPANLVLEHLEGCREVGTRKIRGVGPGSGGGFKDGKFSGQAGLGDYTGTSFQGFADEDGLETVLVWDCIVGCPAQSLDQQSGVSVSTGGGGFRDAGTSTQNGIYGKYGERALPENVGKGDEGGASRFFKQVHGARS